MVTEVEVQATAPAVTLQADADGTVSLPEGFSLSGSDFAQSGPDLVLTAPDGSQIIINDYFNGQVPPDLISANGATIGPELAMQLSGSQAPAQMAQAVTESSVTGEAIGQVETVTGTVSVIHTDGSRGDLSSGDA
ncbi:MAG TPA: hypothetical protein ENI69_10435, partial [Rhodospirillales bacterium]|nr:hypothetical protein [Rhodospirillales bacterium]